MGKCQMAPIRCDKTQWEFTSSLFPCQVVKFPIGYLSILLYMSKLPKTALQPLVDRVNDRLPTWKG
jgi:hypothetical protein